MDGTIEAGSQFLAAWDANASALRYTYDPLQEHDSCGVGFVAALDGKKRRDIVQAGIDARLNVDGIYENAVQSSAVITSQLNFQILIERALRDARSVPGAAAHVSIPVDVSDACVQLPGMTDPAGNNIIFVPKSPAQYRTEPSGTDPIKIGQALDALLAADKPLIFLGNGCRRYLRDPANLAIFTGFVEKFVNAVLNVAIAEQNHGILVAGAFRMRLAVGRADDIAPNRADFLQIAIGTKDPQFAFHDERPVRRSMPMQHDRLIGGEFEQHIDAAVRLVDLVDVIRHLIEPFDLVPDDVAIVECMRRHG